MPDIELNIGTPVGSSDRTDLENLVVARTRVIQELADGDIKPKYKIDNQEVDYPMFRRYLLDEIKKLDDMIEALDGGIGSFETVWRT